ncbi:helix-turn-helix domain-containing protein [Salmonella enterica subsp. diarizonae serovar 50:z52:z35]|nr:AraC family transcriptional regulator [Salmonella enterica subsp. enterica serovar Hvittingfoss]ECG2029214.1 helix-turn-helix domain-containing protein [Salmonella enterica subsp. enterica serovar Hato]EDR8621771.1 helix-turn-helix domain-containing protein [Salmonella enterica]EHN1755507.1 helix-turn-helix domain-containing protein [Salmonella enterica subsp. diarizonae serovar 50:z52:z35]HAK7957803.1 helix-turn-helix domain-containing protein [Salmonella enterica]
MKNTYDLILWIENNLNTGIKTAEISAKAGYSERHLYNRFKKQTGLSVAQYIRRRKLTLAAALLRTTSRTVTEISLMYGFESLQSFSRAFKKQFEEYPTPYRNAWFWDMGLCQPPITSLTYPVHPDMITISGDIPDNSPVLSNKVVFGTDFLLSKKGGQLQINKLLTDINLKVFNSISGMDNFIICGGMKPGVGHDADIYYSVTELSDTDKDGRQKALPPGHYAKVAFSGTYSEIIQFQAWANSHLPTKYKCRMLSGDYFTVFKRRKNLNIYDINYHIPCLPPAILA